MTVAILLTATLAAVGLAIGLQLRRIERRVAEIERMRRDELTWVPPHG